MQRNSLETLKLILLFVFFSEHQWKMSNWKENTCERTHLSKELYMKVKVLTTSSIMFLSWESGTLTNKN